ncbi:hypothetical protein GZL_04338 [Streptomyces sp. 769]|nr:hypothetical protein GZL_04338 [Streptomyces sp. 769]
MAGFPVVACVAFLVAVVAPRRWRSGARHPSRFPGPVRRSRSPGPGSPVVDAQLWMRGPGSRSSVRDFRSPTERIHI